MVVSPGQAEAAVQHDRLPGQVAAAQQGQRRVAEVLRCRRPTRWHPLGLLAEEARPIVRCHARPRAGVEQPGPDAVDPPGRELHGERSGQPLDRGESHRHRPLPRSGTDRKAARGKQDRAGVGHPRRDGLGGNLRAQSLPSTNCRSVTPLPGAAVTTRWSTAPACSDDLLASGVGSACRSTGTGCQVVWVPAGCVPVPYLSSRWRSFQFRIAPIQTTKNTPTMIRPARLMSIEPMNSHGCPVRPI